MLLGSSYYLLLKKWAIFGLFLFIFVLLFDKKYLQRCLHYYNEYLETDKICDFIFSDVYILNDFKITWK